MDDIAFNTATEEGVMEEADEVRVVTIDGWDVAACGGTHVANTREIGAVTVLDRSNPGEGLTRVEFAVGPTAIQRAAATHRSALAAARTAGTSVDDLPTEVERLQTEVGSLEADVRSLTDEVLGARIAGLETVERDGATWHLGAIEGFEANEIGDRLQEAVGDGQVFAVAGGHGRAFLVVASDGTVDANGVVEGVTDAFGGGGGGGPTFAQGGGLDADPADVVAFLR